jgi:tRNA(fMet)-specific endonuclease VapC
MPLLIDSDIVIDHLDEVEQIVMLLRRLAPHRLYISTITYMESFHGVIVDPNRDRAEQKFSALIDVVEMIPVTQPIAHRCALMRADLSRTGKRVRQRALDLLIAATAIEHNLTLVTRNQADYADIPGLILFEDF